MLDVVNASATRSSLASYWQQGTFSPIVRQSACQFICCLCVCLSDNPYVYVCICMYVTTDSWACQSLVHMSVCVSVYLPVSSTFVYIFILHMHVRLFVPAHICPRAVCPSSSCWDGFCNASNITYEQIKELCLWFFSYAYIFSDLLPQHTLCFAIVFSIIIHVFEWASC